MCSYLFLFRLCFVFKSVIEIVTLLNQVILTVLYKQSR